MVIDMHVHPIFYKSICDNKEELEFRKDTFGVWKQGPMDWDEAFAEMDFGGIDKEALLPMDVTTTEGGWIVTNEPVWIPTGRMRRMYSSTLLMIWDWRG